MEISLSTPALLFPAVSLLLLAYTNRFVALAALIRNLHKQYKTDPSAHIIGQIKSLRHRVELIKQMQAAGILSLSFCVLSMILLFLGFLALGKILFAISLLLMMISLILSLVEIRISVHALNLHLSDIERPH